MGTRGGCAPCSGWGFGETREGQAGSSPWDEDVPRAWHGSQEVTVPEALCVPGPEQSRGEGAPRRRRAAAASS